MESYLVAGIDVHKSMLAVVIADAGREGEFQFQRRKFWHDGQRVAGVAGVAGPPSRARGGHGVHRAVLESRYGRSWKATASWLWRRRIPIEPRRAASGISPTPNDSSGGTWPGN